jgi:hypothetical protein
MNLLKWPERTWEQVEEGQWTSRPITRVDVDRRIAIEKELEAIAIDEDRDD